MLEAFYNTQNDPDQTPIRPNSTGKNWISTRIPECAVIIKAGDELVGSTLVLPCTQALMQAFITGWINEAQLVEKIREENITYKTMQTIYFCSAFIVPKHRGKSLGCKSPGPHGSKPYDPKEFCTDMVYFLNNATADKAFQSAAFGNDIV